MSFSLLIDPGHGGDNIGCTGYGLVEKAVNLALARLLRDVARTLGCSVRMTRDDDREVSLAQRALGPPADLVLVLHCDTSPLATVGRLRCYHQPSPTTHLVGRAIATAAPDWCGGGPENPTPVSPDDWTVRAYNCLRHHRSPAVLVECAFLSNPVHARMLQDPAGTAGLVLALQAGVEAARMRKELTLA